MGKAARIRRFRKQALELDPTGKNTRKIARALRRHGRLPTERSLKEGNGR